MGDSFTFDAASAKRIADAVRSVEQHGNRNGGELPPTFAGNADVWPLALTGTNDASGNPLPLGQYLGTYYYADAVTNTAATGLGGLCDPGLTNVVFVDLSRVFDTQSGIFANVLGKWIGFTGPQTNTNATALTMGLLYNPFDLFTLNADWTWGDTTVTGTIPRNTNTTTVDLTWAGLDPVPWCGLKSGDVVLVMPYGNMITHVNYGLAVGWDHMSPAESCQPDLNQPLTPVCNDDGTVSFTTTNYVRVVLSADPASCP